MRHRQITFKLFLLTAVCLTLFIGGLLLFQVKYFGSYFKQQKQNEFTTQFDSLIQILNGSQISETDIRSKLETFKNERGAVPVLYPLNKGGEENLENIKKYISMIENSEMSTIAMNVLIDVLKSGVKPTGRSIEIKTYSDKLQYLVGDTRLEINQNPYLLIVFSSLQPVDEAVGKLGDSFWLVLVIAIAVSVGLAVVISRLIARPLVREIEREKELDRMRMEFIANASHEMKTPLTIISGYSESLLDHVVAGDERTQYEQVIYDESQKMGKLVRDMLEMSILQNDKWKLHYEEVQLDRVISNMAQRFTGLLKEKKITFILEGISPTAVWGNELQIEMALGNVISNAIFHTPQNGSIQIRLCKERDAARIEVENEGESIPEEQLALIWESFFRVDKAHNRQEGRYGLGLSIVKSIIDKHGGKYGASNTLKGVCFFLEIPNFTSRM